MTDDPRLDYLIRQVGNMAVKYQNAAAIADLLDQKQAQALWRGTMHDMEFMLRNLKEYEHQLNMAEEELKASGDQDETA